MEERQLPYWQYVEADACWYNVAVRNIGKDQYGIYRNPNAVENQYERN